MLRIIEIALAGSLLLALGAAFVSERYRAPIECSLRPGHVYVVSDRACVLRGALNVAIEVRP